MGNHNPLHSLADYNESIDFPHPDDPTLAATHPHHKHVPPDMKHHRVPAPDIRYDRPNLPILVAELEGLLAGEGEKSEV